MVIKVIRPISCFPAGLRFPSRLLKNVLDWWIAPPNKKLIPELEGLRGLLAWWVVFHHICMISNAVPLVRHIPLLGHALQNGSRAVLLFMILSGFFITGSLWRDGVTWSGFMVRRIRRIYPAYLVSLAVAVAFFPYLLHGMSRLPWQDWVIVHDRILANDGAARNPGWFAFLYLTLSQGMVPLSVHSFRSFPLVSFLNPSWSLSLEWQFYLIVPFLVLLFRRDLYSAYLGAFLIMALILIGQLFFGLQGDRRLFTYCVPSFLPMSASLFFLGALSLFVRKFWLKGGWKEVPWRLKGLFLLIVVLVAVQQIIVLVLWLAVLASTVPGLPKSTLGALLRVKPLQYLGIVSYSTYIFHITVVDVVVVALTSAFPHMTPVRTFLLSCLIAPPLILAASIVLYHEVEHRFYR